MQGYYNYFVVPTDGHLPHSHCRALATLADAAHSAGAKTWRQITKLARDWLLKPSVLHPWPSARFAVA